MFQRGSGLVYGQSDNHAAAAEPVRSRTPVLRLGVEEDLVPPPNCGYRLNHAVHTAAIAQALAERLGQGAESSVETDQPAPTSMGSGAAFLLTGSQPRPQTVYDRTPRHPIKAHDLGEAGAQAQFLDVSRKDARDDRAHQSISGLVSDPADGSQFNRFLRLRGPRRPAKPREQSAAGGKAQQAGSGQRDGVGRDAVQPSPPQDVPVSCSLVRRDHLYIVFDVAKQSLKRWVAYDDVERALLEEESIPLLGTRTPPDGRTGLQQTDVHASLFQAPGCGQSADSTADDDHVRMIGVHGSYTFAKLVSCRRMEARLVASTTRTTLANGVSLRRP